ncbi:flagellar hook-basal body complex protein FliE [bacterium]|nr:flagellar hook-basal body complex protein FliE [bacterium]
MADISRIGQISGQFPKEIQKAEDLQKNQGPSFGDTLKGLVGDVDNLQKTAEESTRRMLTGQIEDVHQVMVAMEEAQTSFQLMMEIRNKIVDAYKEVMRMQV